MKRFRWLVVCVAAALLLIAAAYWFSPFGSGEDKVSPDGRYQASVSNFRRGTWLHGRVDYIDIEIIERSTGKTVWKAERYPQPSETPPEFGDRSVKFIQWSPDSRSVSIPVGGPADAVWLVP